jgi:hypothetical protein
MLAKPKELYRNSRVKSWRVACGAKRAQLDDNKRSKETMLRV